MIAETKAQGPSPDSLGPQAWRASSWNSFPTFSNNVIIKLWHCHSQPNLLLLTTIYLICILYHCAPKLYEPLYNMVHYAVMHSDMNQCLHWVGLILAFSKNQPNQTQPYLRRMKNVPEIFAAGFPCIWTGNATYFKASSKQIRNVCLRSPPHEYPIES